MLVQPSWPQKSPNEIPGSVTEEYPNPPAPKIAEVGEYQRTFRWYNGSLMGPGGKDAALFGPHGRLRTLHVKITSNETPASDLRGYHYRRVGDLLARFFPLAITDLVVEELLAVPGLSLPRDWDDALCVVLAAIEMYLRKHHRLIVRRGTLAEISSATSLPLSLHKVHRAKSFLGKAGFWKEHQHEINLATYEILRSLVLQIATTVRIETALDPLDFRRRLYHGSMALVQCLEASRHRPQFHEVYAHAIVSVAAEAILGRSVLTSQGSGDRAWNNRVYDAKRKFLKILQELQQRTSPGPEVQPALEYPQFLKLLKTMIPCWLPFEAVQFVQGQLQRFDVACSPDEAHGPIAPFLNLWLAGYFLRFVEVTSSTRGRDAK